LTHSCPAVPIIQNGKLIGAVTHVLVDDPTTGYGIFAENMLELHRLWRQKNQRSIMKTVSDSFCVSDTVFL